MADTNGIQTRPRPFAINKPMVKVQDIVKEEDVRHLFTYEYTRLDATNFAILLLKEQETRRLEETLTKNRSRPHFEADDANEHFFDSLVKSVTHQVYGEEGEPEVVPYEDFHGWTVEVKAKANTKFLECKSKFKKLLGARSLDFMREKDGEMLFELAIGDPEEPSYLLGIKVKRPKRSKRSVFRDNFSYGITERPGDLPITKTIVDLRTGVTTFDEYFIEVVMDDPTYSEVVFLNEAGELDHKYGEKEEDRIQFLQLVNPQYKVEVSGSMVIWYNKSESK